MATKTRNSFVKQAAILAAASLIARFIGFLYRIPLTRLIGDDGNAFYNSAHYMYAMAIVISSGALPVAILKLVSERIALGRFRDAHEMFKNALIVAAGLGLAATLFVGLGAGWLMQLRFYYFPDAIVALRVLSPAIFIVAVLAVFRGYFQGMGSMLPTAASQTFEQIVNAIFSILLAHTLFELYRPERSAAGAAAGTSIGAAVGLIIILLLYSAVAKDLRVRAAGNLHTIQLSGGVEKRGNQIKTLLRTAFPILLGMGILASTNMIDTGMARYRIMASGAFTEAEVIALVGQFAGKFIIITTLPLVLSTALSQAVIPDISSSHATGHFVDVRRKINIALRLSMIVSIPAAVGLIVLPDQIIALLFPNQPGGGIQLRVGAISIVFLALMHVSSGALQGIGKVRLPMLAAFCGVIIKLPINWALMANPNINILGAVISTIVCFVVAACINLYFLYKYTGVLPDFVGAFLKPGISAIGMGAACFVSYFVINIFVPDRAATVIALLISIPVYFTFMWLVGGFAKHDIDIIPMPAGFRRWLKS